MNRGRSAWWGVLGAAVLPFAACQDGVRSHGPAAVHDGPAAARFPGAGRGSAGLSLAMGTATVTCDQPGPAPGGSTGPAPGQTATRECYFDADHPDDPAAIMEWIVEASAEGELVHARLTFNPRFVDNTYGENAIGWDGTGTPAPKPGKPMPKPTPMKSGHTFKDLVGSDHAEFTLSDADGVTRLKFKADYLSESASAPSGYMSLGVRGGEGKMLTGAADAVVAVSTSLDRNLNTCGYEGYTSDSPATDASYTANASAPHWDFRVVYDVWVERAAFGDVGFGRASVEFVHASPSKAGRSTIEVVPRECPPGWPPYCTNPDGCSAQEPPPRCGDEPDESCTTYPPCDGGECPDDPDVGTTY